MELISITNLSPDAPPPAHKSIRAVVTLVWPYSVSSKQCALLLAEPDFRLRYRKGQVRALFTGPSAEAVAKLHVKIGDEVVLGLEGANWKEESGHVRTPGKSVGEELVFNCRLYLRLTGPDRRDVTASVDAGERGSPVRNIGPPAMYTPTHNGMNGLRSLGDTSASRMVYDSPAFAKRLRSSGEDLWNNAYDPFEEDGLPPRKLQRTSFGKVQRWRYEARSPSPERPVSSQSESSSIDAGNVDTRIPEVITSAREPELLEEPSWPINDTQHGAMVDENAPQVVPRHPPLSPAGHEKRSDRWEAHGFTSDLPPDAISASEMVSVPEMQTVQYPVLPLSSPWPGNDQSSAFAQHADIDATAGDDSIHFEDAAFQSFDPATSHEIPHISQDVSTASLFEDSVSTGLHAPASTVTYIVPASGEFLTEFSTADQIRGQDSFMSDVLALESDSDSDEAIQSAGINPPTNYNQDNAYPSEEMVAPLVMASPKDEEVTSTQVILQPQSQSQAVPLREGNRALPETVLVQQMKSFAYPGQGQRHVSSEMEDQAQIEPVEASEPSQPAPSAHGNDEISLEPHTPSKSSPKSPVTVSRNGSGTTQTSSHASGETPESVREKVMAQTISSLFGFHGAESTSNVSPSPSERVAISRADTSALNSSDSNKSAQPVLSASDWGLGPPPFGLAEGLIKPRNVRPDTDRDEIFNYARTDPPAAESTQSTAKSALQYSRDADDETQSLPHPVYAQQPAEHRHNPPFYPGLTHPSHASNVVHHNLQPPERLVGFDATTEMHPRSLDEQYGHAESSSIKSMTQDGRRDPHDEELISSNYERVPQARDAVEIDMQSESDSDHEESVASSVASSQLAESESAAEPDPEAQQPRASSPHVEIPIGVHVQDALDARPHLEVRATLDGNILDVNHPEEPQSDYEVNSETGKEADVGADVVFDQEEQRIVGQSESIVPSMDHHEQIHEAIVLDSRTGLHSSTTASVESTANASMDIDTEPIIDSSNTFEREHEIRLTAENPLRDNSPSSFAGLQESRTGEAEDIEGSAVEDGPPSTLGEEIERDAVPVKSIDPQYGVPLVESDRNIQLDHEAHLSPDMEAPTHTTPENGRDSPLPGTSTVHDVQNVLVEADITPRTEIEPSEFTQLNRNASLDLQVPPSVRLDGTEGSRDQDSPNWQELILSPGSETDALGQSPGLSKSQESQLLDAGLPIASRTRSRLSILEVDMIEYPERKSPRKPSDEELINAQLQTEMREVAEVRRTEHPTLPHTPAPHKASRHRPTPPPESDRTADMAAKESLQMFTDDVAAAQPLDSSNAPAVELSTTFATPARRAFSGRLSQIPSVLSSWFSPKRVFDTPKQEVPVATPSKKAIEAKSKDVAFEALSQGFSTPLAYFSPLVHLSRALNRPTNETFDVLASVVKGTAPPARASDGPRDFYTVFDIADGSGSVAAPLRVEVFRPWKAKLPQASEGDVILLRGFTVKSRNRQPFLLSSDASSYCVWRFSTDENTLGDGGNSSATVREETKGPPVELGDEERVRVRLLRRWWMAAYAGQEEDS